MKISKEDRIKIFNNTKDIYKSDENLKESIKKSINSQRIYKDSDIINNSKKRFKDNAKIIVSSKKSFEAALNYREEKVCVLNFASSTNPGGGVEKGSSAQEESLCRCSTLYPCLSASEVYNAFYNEHRILLNENKMTPLYNDDCIYTKDVVIFKTDDDYPSLMKKEDWKKVDIISCAAPNLRNKPSNSMNPNAGTKKVIVNDKELYEIQVKRIRKIFSIAKENEVDVLILGAFGCGAFCNPPEVVSRAMKDVIKEFINDFKVIEFAVYCNEYDTKNFDIFDKYIKFKEKLD